MNILLIGSGGRECALAWKIAQSSLVSHLYIAPGNAGTSNYGISVALAETDFDGIAKFCIENTIKMVVVGPENPLAMGIYDYFKADSKLSDIMIIAPSKKAAQLESSKDYAKKFMFRHGIPTAAYQTFTEETIEASFEFLKTLNPPYVLKADGLAAGKGVIIVETIAEAQAVLNDFLLDHSLGTSGNKVVIEEFLSGIECSVFVLTDGKNYLLLPEAKDYKRIGEGDTGLNTGGMGSISPVPFVTPEFLEKITQKIIIPTVRGIEKEQLDYCGFIFFGLIQVGDEPYVIEYNVRMGDPETESVMPRIESDLVSHLQAAAKGTLDSEKISISKEASATVMLVASGYPGAYPKGDEITINSENINASQLFFAGATISENQTILTSGGRVLAVTSKGENIAEALATSYQTINHISFNGMNFRKDIGYEFMQKQV
jgi:phosphoribosylamine--glycine ligase